MGTDTALLSFAVGRTTPQLARHTMALRGGWTPRAGRKAPLSPWSPQLSLCVLRLRRPDTVWPQARWHLPLPSSYNLFLPAMTTRSLNKGATVDAAHDSLNEIDTQRKEELENLLETLTVELRQRLEAHQRVHGRNEGLKRERDQLFDALRDMEALCQEHRSLPGADAVLNVLCDDSTVRHLM